MADEPIIPIETLRQLLSYDPETGALTWRERPLSLCPDLRSCNGWNARWAGQPALTADSRGYRHGNIFKRKIKAHRAAWALYYGEWPDGDIDHIDGSRDNNRISNLRVVDRTTNNRNVKLRAGSASGVPGVTWDRWKRKWAVYVGNTYIGNFSDVEDAIAARRKAEEGKHFHPNHGRAP